MKRATPVERPDYVIVGECGAVYIDCLDSRIAGWANHYIGFVYTPRDVSDTDIRRRVSRRDAKHRKGQGSRMLAYAAANGIEWHIVRIFANVDKHFERRLKRQRNAWRYCPRCNTASRIPATPWKERRER